VGAEPLYVDVDRETLGMSGAALATCAPGACSAVLATHLYGRLADMASIQASARRLGVPVIEDCAQAHGARNAQGIAGSLGLAGCFSFYPTKNLGALGDGGAVVTNDAAFADEVRKLRQYGWEGKYHVGRPGGRNSRLDEIQAAFLFAKLPRLDGWNERRREVARRYRAAISTPHVRLPAPVDASDVAHLFVVRSNHRDALAAHLKAAGVPVDIHYPIPDHRQPVWGGRFDALRLAESEAACASVLTLPCFPEMTADEVDAVAGAVNSFAPDRVPVAAR
jgi:dTDP-4-amino-4,6-dideoxygalactose transaminase